MSIGLAANTLLAGLIPFGLAYPIALSDARLVASGHQVASTFYPLGYVAFLVGPLFLGGINGVLIAQTLAYACYVVLCYAALRTKLSPLRCAIGTTLAALLPQSVVAIRHIGDAALTFPLLVAAVASIAWLRREGYSSTRTICLAVSFGWLITVRTNAYALVVFVVIALWYVMPVRGWLILVLGTISSIVLVTTPIHGRPLFISTNGPYTFFIGANPFSEEALLCCYSAESSVAVAPDTPGPMLEANPWIDLRDNSQLLHLGLQYVREHPGDFVRLGGVKLFTLARPYLFEQGRIQTIFEIVQVLPLAAWVAFRLLWRRRYGLLPAGLMYLLVVLYIAPFLVTNAEPRFRYPLDAILLLDVWCLVCGRWPGRDGGALRLASLGGLRSAR